MTDKLPFKISAVSEAGIDPDFAVAMSLTESDHMTTPIELPRGLFRFFFRFLADGELFTHAF